MRILHLTDPHLFADENGALRGVRTSDSLDAVLEDYRRQEWQADLAVCTGDIIQDDSAAAYERFREKLATLDIPVVCIPGNHDIRSLMRKALSEAPFSYCPNLEYGGWLMASVDTCVPGKAAGSISEREIGKLETAVAAGDVQHAIVFMHHPPVTMGSAWLDSVGLENADTFMRRVSAMRNVRAIVFGHVHQVYDQDHDGTRVLSTPSTCRQFKPGSTVFEVDDNPPAYRRFELGRGGLIQTELIWVGDA